MKVVVRVSLLRGGNLRRGLPAILDRDLEAGRHVVERDCQPNLERDVGERPLEVGILLGCFVPQGAHVVLNGPELHRMLWLKRLNLQVLLFQLLHIRLNRVCSVPLVAASIAAGPLLVLLCRELKFTGLRSWRGCWRNRWCLRWCCCLPRRRGESPAGGSGGLL